MGSFEGNVLQLLKEPFTPEPGPDGRHPRVAAELQAERPPAASEEAPLASDVTQPPPSVEPHPAPQPPLEADVEAALATLAGNPAFAKVGHDDLMAVAQHGRRRRVLEGHVLVRQGQPADRVYMLLSGSARMERPRKWRDPVVSRFEPGEVVGAVGLLYGGRYTATVSALEDQRVLELARDDVARLFRQHPALKPAFRRILHSRVMLQ